MKNLKQISLIIILLLSINTKNYAQGNNYESLTIVKSESAELIDTQLNDNNDITKLDKRVLLYCYTVSCCSIGPISIEVWSETTCVYAETRNKNSLPILKTKLFFKDKAPDSGIVFIEKDIVIAGIFDSNGNQYVLPKGKYKLDKDNSFSYTPKLLNLNQSKAVNKKWCIEEVVDGTIFGHHYHYSIKICISFSTEKNSNSYYFPDYIDLQLSKEDLKKVANGEDKFVIEKDLKFKINGQIRTVKAGEYQIAKDGKIYLYY